MIVTPSPSFWGLPRVVADRKSRLKSTGSSPNSPEPSTIRQTPASISVLAFSRITPWATAGLSTLKRTISPLRARNISRLSALPTAATGDLSPS